MEKSIRFWIEKYATASTELSRKIAVAKLKESGSFMFV